MKPRILSCLIAVMASGAFNSCKPNLDVPTPWAGSADMSHFVVIGDDYMSGYQDGALFKKGQQLSIGALIARQFPNSTELSQPFIQDDDGIGVNGNPFVVFFVFWCFFGFCLVCLGATSLFPISSEISSLSAQAYLARISYSVSNFAVPQLKMKDYFTPSIGNTNGNDFFNRFASNPGTSTVY